MPASLLIHWGRVILGAVFSEIVVIAILGVIIVTHRYFIAPGRSAADYEAFAHRAGYNVAPAAAALAVFFSALWATRNLTSSFVANGTLVGIIAVVLTLGFLFSAKPGERFMYGVSFGLRIIGGYLGGVVAHQIFTGRVSFSLLT